MTQYTDETRTCIRDGCGKTFRVKVKGQKQIYCGKSCRAFDYQMSIDPEVRRKWWTDYYYRNLDARREYGRQRERRRCECGRLKAKASDAMCSECAAIAPVGNRP